MNALGAWARFDDVRAGTAWAFPEIAYDLVAEQPGDVAGVLDELDRATAKGWWAFGFVSYEAASGLGLGLPVHEPLDGLPLVWFGVCAPPKGVPLVPSSPGPAYQVGPWNSEWSRDQHRRKVEVVRREIAAGQTYQCNLTTRLNSTVEGDLLALYADLVQAQGGAYNAFVDLGRFAIASASPELFFELTDDMLRMRPMKGTAQRGSTPTEDAENLARLCGSEKERAENIMILDMVRNDVARLAKTGTVAVPRLCRVEQYETVHQMTSEVTAQIDPDVGTAGLFRALFPCGSVTGAPKTRTMQIIRELEDGPRGVYCGAVGMVAPAGSPFRARFNVAIRTVLADREACMATYGSGGGITWDSDPGAEYAELLTKAEILKRDPHPEGAL